MAHLPARRNAIERSDPASLLDDFSSYMNRMMGWNLPAMELGEQSWTPMADLSETDTEYHIDIEVPGVQRDEIAIDLEGQDLTVSGKYRREDHTDGNLRRSTRRDGQFEYMVRLAHSIDADKCAAQLQDGVLCITIPKAASAAQRKIEIK